MLNWTKETEGSNTQTGSQRNKEQVIQRIKNHGNKWMNENRQNRAKANRDKETKQWNYKLNKYIKIEQLF